MESKHGIFTLIELLVVIAIIAILASINDYLLNLRLENGAMLLRKSDAHVSEIALRVGFQDGNYFSRMFRRKFDLSPRAYRNSFHPVRES